MSICTSLTFSTPLFSSASSFPLLFPSRCHSLFHFPAISGVVFWFWECFFGGFVDLGLVMEGVDWYFFTVDRWLVTNHTRSLNPDGKNMSFFIQFNQSSAPEINPWKTGRNAKKPSGLHLMCSLLDLLIFPLFSSMIMMSWTYYTLRRNSFISLRQIPIRMSSPHRLVQKWSHGYQDIVFPQHGRSPLNPSHGDSQNLNQIK